MVQAEGSGTGRRVRRWRSVAEKRRIVQLALEPGASVALVARAHGVNANQVFKWRRAFERGELSEPGVASTGLLPVRCLLDARPRHGRLAHMNGRCHRLLSISSFPAVR